MYFILKENGEYILQEDSFKIELESYNDSYNAVGFPLSLGLGSVLAGQIARIELTGESLSLNEGDIDFITYSTFEVESDPLILSTGGALVVQSMPVDVVGIDLILSSPAITPTKKVWISVTTPESIWIPVTTPEQ